MRGTLLGNYRVMRQLGEGGMGLVYVGRHETLGHRVVVKVLRPEMMTSADMVRRFFNEAQAATAIDNPGIVQVFDFGTTPDGCAFIVMELLEGQTLTARLARRRLDAAACCRIGCQIANVLQAAHERGITHRDLKPDNLFLVPDAEVQGGERVKVLDFGIAKLAGELHAAGVQTRTGVLMGTPKYMAPEQCRGAVAAEPRSDIYALGCILFEMVCGRPPFVGEEVGDILGAHLYSPPPHPQSLAPDLPLSLAQLITHLLAKQPDERPQTMAAVSQTLGVILGTLDAPAPRAPIPASPPATARSPAPPLIPPHERKTRPLRLRTSTPAPGGAPMDSPIPAPSSESTAIHTAAAGSTTRRARGALWRSVALIAVVAATAVGTFVIATAVTGSRSRRPRISHEQPPAAAPREDTAARSPAAPGPTPNAGPEPSPHEGKSIDP